MAVFCQKPLARTEAEARMVVEAAKRNNRLLGVDFCYRSLSGVEKIRQLLQSQKTGKIFAVDLVFHNAYGPDKLWFYDRKLSGGGCVIDLGVHLIDLALWCLDSPKVAKVCSQLFAKGGPLSKPARQLEDFAVVRIGLETGTNIQICCSWNLSAGSDAVIAGSFYGTKGGAEFRNVNGSFTEFTASRFEGTRREPLVTAADALSGRMAVEWTRQLVQNPCYDPAVESALSVASIVDQIYDR
jgi:predicted dehydrogenase